MDNPQRQVFKLSVTPGTFASLDEEEQSSIQNFNRPNKKARTSVKESGISSLATLQPSGGISTGYQGSDGSNDGAPSTSAPGASTTLEELSTASLDPTERRRMQMRLSEFAKRFSKRLGFVKVDVDNLGNMTDQQLIDLEKDVLYAMQSKNQSGIIKMVVGTGLGAWEVMGVKNGYKISGIAKTLEEDKEWQDLLDEMEITHGFFVEIPAWQRTIAKLLQTSYKLHRQNEYISKIPPNVDVPVSDNLRKKYAHL